MKRVLDIIISLAGLLVVALLIPVIAIWIKMDSPGPVLFTQRRIGKNDQEFIMYKFRTMHVGTPEVATDQLKESRSYITRIGYYLRKYSLDELPQLFNILLGDMSIVGPRPALYNQHELRERRIACGISAIKPGLTGWAQVNGRDEIPLEQKINLDHYYYQNYSLTLDLKIIYMTVNSVLTGTGEKAA